VLGLIVTAEFLNPVIIVMIEIGYFLELCMPLLLLKEKGKYDPLI
jgi:hypothetical protein